jgi:putative hydrolase of the HAD superfamily
MTPPSSDVPTSSLRVVFDLDDTLYPERDFALSGFRAAGAWAHNEWDIPDPAAYMKELLDTGHLGGLFRMSLERSLGEVSDDELARFVDVYRRHEPELQLFEGAQDVIDLAASKGPIGLITDGTHWVQARKVAALGIAEHFTSIIYTGALGGREFHKPHPRSFEMMEGELGAKLGADIQMVYIGDNPAKDFVAPNARGWTTIQLVRDGGIHDNQAVVEGGEPHHTIDALKELHAILESLGRR